MQFEGEHLSIGYWGHFFVLLAFTASLLSTIAYGIASFTSDTIARRSWINYGRITFLLQSAAVLAVFGCIFYLCANHYIEYLYAYKHTSKELEFKYLFASIWEDQSGSFLLWSIWHCVLGWVLINRTRERKDPNAKALAAGWEAPVMSVFSLAQVFLAMMIMGVYIFGTKLGNSPFVLTRNEINGPIFSMPNYLSLMKDGVGLNVLLRNYWMVIHPPVLFLGFASTLVPFAFAYAGLQSKRYGDWVKPALPYVLFSVCALGVGIMMGGKWAYESLSFGGYWAWDPVENASLVPWLILVAGLHTMVIYKATGHSLKASYLFAILSFVFVLYSTFLTRTGILGDTSVHAFTEAGKAMNILIFSFMAFFTLASLALFVVRLKHIPSIAKEENTSSREFWMFIGSLVLFLSALFVSGKTSVPVFNAIFNTKIAPPEDVEFSYNKVMVLIAIIIGLLTAITQFFKYKQSDGATLLKKIAVPTATAAVITAGMAIFYPITYSKMGPGFLVALYIALFASIYAIVGNAAYIFTGLKGNLKAAGGSVAHLGFTLMLAGMIISAGNKKIISEERFKAFTLPTGIDPLTKQQDNALENMNLVRQVPSKMADYEVTYLHDSMGHETGRRFYHLLFQRKDSATKAIKESFVLNPDVYMMKNNNMSSNPDTKSYLTHDIFTYISYALNPEKNVDTATFKIHEVSEGEAFFYSKGYMVFNKAVKETKPSGPRVIADITITASDSTKYHAKPVLAIDSLGIVQYDDTVYAQNLYVRFAGVDPEHNKIKIGVKESDSMIDFVTIKAYIFPYINLVWAGLIIMAIGLTMSMAQRARLQRSMAAASVLVIAVALVYMFLFAAA